MSEYTPFFDLDVIAWPLTKLDASLVDPFSKIYPWAQAINLK